MKTLLLSTLLLLSAGLLQAQKIKPGIGVNFTDFSQDPASGDVKGKAGFQIGGSVQLGKKLYIEPGLFYLTKSSEVTYTNQSVNTTITSGLSGFRIPVAVGLQLFPSKLGLRVFGGGSAFFVTKVSDELDQAQQDNINKTSFGVFAGAGLDLGMFYLDASYEWSATNIQKNVQNIDFGKTRSAFLTAGIKF